jgi:hypothetical protein
VARKKEVKPSVVNMNCPFCGRTIENDSGPRVDVSKLLKLQRGNLAYAHQVCVDEKILQLKSTP